MEMVATFNLGDDDDVSARLQHASLACPRPRLRPHRQDAPPQPPTQTALINEAAFTQF